MKNVKIVLFSFMTIVAFVTLASFISDDYRKQAFAQVCYHYIGSNKTPYDGTPVRVISNWMGPENPGGECPESEVLCSFCFDTDNYTFEQARNAFGDYLDNLKTQFPSDAAWIHVPSPDPFTIPNTTIQVYKEEAIY